LKIVGKCNEKVKFFPHGSEHSKIRTILVKIRASRQSGALHSFGSDSARPEICIFKYIYAPNKTSEQI